jgi:D-amino-acid dehydrogenase
MRSEKHVLIIGSGVIGLCSAYYLIRRGHRVTIVDRVAPEHEGCSFGNAGFCCPSHFVPLAAPGMVARGLKWMWNPESPFWIKPRFDRELFDWGWKFWRASNKRHVTAAAPLLRDLQFASRAAFEELADSSNNDFGLVKKGLLNLCKTQHALDEEAKVAEAARNLGVAAEVLDAAGTTKLEPGIRMDIAGAAYFPQDCYLWPNRFMTSLRARLEKSGAQLSWRSNVTGFKVGGNRIEAVATAAGELRADEYVLCGGSWSPILGRELGLKLPMQAGKGYSLTLPNPRQRPQICAILTERRCAVTPIGGGGLRFGGTMEMTGLNERINPARVQGIIKSALMYYPDFTPEDFAGVKPWCGLRPCSPDGLPYVGRTAQYLNLTIATGHAMLGLSLGPATGQIVAQIISDIKPFIDIGLLDPDRYS